MNFVHVTIFVASLSSVGCVTTEQFSQNMDYWLGMEESVLIQSLGVPSKSYIDSQRNKYIVYERESTRSVPGTSPTYTTQKIGNTYQTYQSGGTEPSKISLRCEVTFQLREGVISSWSSTGNDCVAPVPMNQLFKGKESKYDPYKSYDPVIKSILELEKP